MSLPAFPSRIAGTFLLVALVAFFVVVSSPRLGTATLSASTYLSDSEKDSSNFEIAPWGEIIEVSVKADAIVVRSGGLFNYSLNSGDGNGWLVLFFDEDLDNRTDVVLRFAKYITRESSRYLCYLYRFGNHSYYYNGTWHNLRGLYDERIEENATLGETAFHLDRAIKTEARLKIATYYSYDITYLHTHRTWKIGGDTAPDCPWNISDTISPRDLENLAAIANDTRFPYPSATLMLGEPEKPLPPPPLAFADHLTLLFSSLRTWITGNTITVVSLMVLLVASVYSVSNRVRPFLNITATYLIAAGLVYVSATTESIFLPVLFSVALLLPLFAWYRSADVLLSSHLTVGRKSVWVEVFALFSMGLLIRIPFRLFVFPIPLEKTPLLYLVVLTILLIDKNPLSVYGLRKDSLARSILTGLSYYLTYAIPFFGLVFSLTYMFTGYLAFDYYNLPFALWVFPFMILCVGMSEELLFRGFIQTRLAKAYGKNKALLVQALLFGAWHFVHYVMPFDPIGMLDRFLTTFALGLAFGLFYRDSGNLIPLIVFHGITDTIMYGAGSPTGIYLTPTLFDNVLRVSMVVGLVFQVFSSKFLARKAKFGQSNDNNGSDDH